MTEWRRLELVKAERDVARRLAAALEDELSHERDRVAALEEEVLDLMSDLAAARLELARVARL